MTLDLKPLWDFGDPEGSERRFQAALTAATGDEALILQTQIARTYGLRRDFARAREILTGLAPALQEAGPEARVRFLLELGRAYVSVTHSADSMTLDDRERARTSYQDALSLAAKTGMEGLAVDALHMLALVETEPVEQLKWNREALALVESSVQPAAKEWEPSLRHNVGCTLHALGRFDEALDSFAAAVVLRERGTDAEATRVARWMVAWTLRALGRLEDALAIQLRLERECELAGAPDPYVFEELERLFRARSESAQADYYAEHFRGASARS